MKRSEMAKIIGEYFRETDISDIETEEGSYYHGRILLAILESEGMMPPFVDCSVIGPDKVYFDMYVEDVRYSGLCEWESEGE